MKICAITMVYRDHWALAQWHRHFSGHLGTENLFVIAHGADPEIARICPGSSIITIPRDGVERFDATRARILNGLQSALGQVYDWVIRTDCDELICLDPQHHASFAALFAAQTGDAIFALGLNLAEQNDDPPLHGDEAVLGARRNAVFAGHYSKAFAVRRDLPLVLHGVRRPARQLADFPFILPRGVYLVHLKFANRAALEIANTHRAEIANSDGTGLPGKAWRKPGQESARFFRAFDALPRADWSQAESEAHAAINANPVRDPESGVLRAQNLRFEQRTQLPDWFACA